MALWWINGNLLQEGLCHTQVYCTQSPCPHSSPLRTRTSSADTQTQFCLSLNGVSGSWCTQGLFELSEHLWRVWSLMLNAISPLLPSCWSSPLSLDVGYLLKVTPALCSCHSSTYRLAGASLSLDVGYLLTVTPALCSCRSKAVFLSNSKYGLPRCLSGKESVFSW